MNYYKNFWCSLDGGIATEREWTSYHFKEAGLIFQEFMPEASALKLVNKWNSMSSRWKYWVE